jgi:hypothetical protein
MPPLSIPKHFKFRPIFHVDNLGNDEIDSNTKVVGCLKITNCFYKFKKVCKSNLSSEEKEMGSQRFKV